MSKSEQQPDEFQDSLLDAIERTYRAARTDETTGDILPTHVAMQKILTAYGIPPEMLGEPSNTNTTMGTGYLFTHSLFTEHKKALP
jgi:hypothetical protein